MGSTAIFGDCGAGASTSGSSRTAADMEADGGGASILVLAREAMAGLDCSRFGAEETDSALPPHPAAAATAFCPTSVFATAGCGAGLGGAGTAGFFSAGVDGAVVNFACAAAAFAGATIAGALACAAGAFAACDLDSLHFSRSSSNSLPF